MSRPHVTGVMPLQSIDVHYFGLSSHPLADSDRDRLPCRAMARSGGMMIVAAFLMLTSAFAQVAQAQSLGDLAAWDALVVSPLGALPSVIGPMGRAGIAVQYGRWRYDADDAIHNDIGVTLSHQLGPRGTQLSVTGAFLSLSCGDCDSWLSAGADVRTPLLAHALAGDSLRHVSGELALRLSGGGARYLGDGHAVAYSAALQVPVSLAVPVGAARLRLAASAGVGIGRLSSADNDAYGTLGIVAVSAGWAFSNGVVLEATNQRVELNGAPSQVGVSVRWSRR